MRAYYVDMTMKGIEGGCIYEKSALHNAILLTCQQHYEYQISLVSMPSFASVRCGWRILVRLYFYINHRSMSPVLSRYVITYAHCLLPPLSKSSIPQACGKSLRTCREGAIPSLGHSLLDSRSHSVSKAHRTDVGATTTKPVAQHSHENDCRKDPHSLDLHDFCPMLSSPHARPHLFLIEIL